MNILFLILFINTIPNTIENKEGKIRIYEKVDSSWFEFYFPDEFSIIDFPKIPIEPIKSKNGHFYGMISGRRIRFFGTTIGWHFMKAPDNIIVKNIKYMKSLGINCVRIHPSGLWNSSNESFNKEILKQLDFITKELKSNDIYYSFYSPLTMIYDGYKSLPFPVYKGLGLLDTNIINRTKIFWDSLLTHINAFTDLRYKEDPALAFLILTNENSVSKLYYQINGRKLLKEYWNQYIVEINDSTYKFPQNQDDKNFKKFLKFSAYKDSLYFSDMKSYIREIGYRGPITCTNNPFSFYEQRVFYNISDFMAVHNYGYYTHGTGGGLCSNKSQIIQKDAEMKDYPTRILANKYYRKPVIVDEWNKGYPVDSRVEATIMIPSFAGLYDYDGLFYFSFFEHYDYLLEKFGYSKYYQTSLEQPFSIQAIFMPSIAYAFRRFLMPELKDSIIIGLENVNSFETYLDYRFKPIKKEFWWIYYLRRIIFKFDNCSNLISNNFKSEPENILLNKNMTWNFKKGFFSIEGDKFFCFAGKLNKYYSEKGIKIKGTDDFIAITIITLDDNEIGKSKEILITIGSDAISKGDSIYTLTKYSENNILPPYYWFPSKKKQKTIPRIPGISLIKPSKIEFYMNNKNKNLKLYALNSKNKKIGIIPINYEKEVIHFQLDMKIYKTCYYLLQK